MNIAFATWPAVAVLVSIAAAALFWGRAAVSAFGRVWLPLILQPLSWLAMIYWAGQQRGAPGSYEFGDMLPLNLGLAASVILGLWLLLRHRGGTPFFITWAISNMLMASWVWIRAGVWLGSAL